MTKRVLLLLAEGFELLEAACFTDVFGWASIDGEEVIELISAGWNETIPTTFGFHAVPDAHVNDLDLSTFDAVAIPGGFGTSGFYIEAMSEPFLDVIRHFAADERPIASVCVAAIPLGAAGILHGRCATTYHQAGGTRKATLESYGAQFIDRPIVTDRNIISSTGPGTGIEVTFALLAQLTSAENADNIRTLMRVPRPSETWLHTPQVVGQGTGPSVQTKRKMS